MSWGAQRYHERKYDWHHVPPRHPAVNTPLKMRVKKIDHRAYHQLFSNAGSLEQCIEILKRDWWPEHRLAIVPKRPASTPAKTPAG